MSRSRNFAGAMRFPASVPRASHSSAVGRCQPAGQAADASSKVYRRPKLDVVTSAFLYATPDEGLSRFLVLHSFPSIVTDAAVPIPVRAVEGSMALKLVMALAL